MIAAGYMAKQLTPRPDWLKASAVVDLCSVSACVARTFCDYIRHWRHNGYWFFDSPQLLAEVARAQSVDLAGHQLFYYEVFEQQFDEQRGRWRPFEAQEGFKTEVELPGHKRLLGFDVVSFSAQTSPECSPLSCNKLAESIAVNQHCLLESCEQARTLLEAGAFSNSEPGPFRVFAVYSCAAG